MQLGIVADEISPDFRKAVEQGKRAGMRSYEVRFLKTGRVPMCDESELREVERVRDGEGVEITALSPGLFKWTDDKADYQREIADVLPRSLDLAQRWGLSSLIVFGFHKPGATEDNGDTKEFPKAPDIIVEWMAKAAEVASRNGLSLQIESEPVCYADTLEHTVEMIKRSGAANIGINYDPGNLSWMTRRDEPERLRKAASFVTNMHVKDLLPEPRGSGRPNWVVPGTGMIDYSKHFSMLSESGYRGQVSIEPHMRLDEHSLRAYVETVAAIYLNAVSHGCN